jgi:hypothetical protein
MVRKLALATAVAVSLAGCHGDCSNYNCPYPDNALVSLPNGAPPLASITVSSPCTTNFSVGDSESALVVKVTGSSAVTCRVDGTLVDGTQLEVLVEFQTTPCCVSLTPVNPYVSFGTPDAGSTTE